MNAMQHSGGHAVMAGAQARRHAGTQARRLAGSGSRQNSHPKGVHEHNSGIRRDSVDRGWKTELQHPIVHRHEAILIQKLRHHSVSNAATGRSCASQQTGKSTGRNARATHQIRDTSRQTGLYLRRAVPERGVFHCADHRRLAIRQQPLCTGLQRITNAPLHIVFAGLAAVRGACAGKPAR